MSSVSNSDPERTMVELDKSKSTPDIVVVGGVSSFMATTPSTLVTTEFSLANGRPVKWTWNWSPSANKVLGTMPVPLSSTALIMLRTFTSKLVGAELPSPVTKDNKSLSTFVRVKLPVSVALWFVLAQYFTVAVLLAGTVNWALEPEPLTMISLKEISIRRSPEAWVASEPSVNESVTSVRLFAEANDGTPSSVNESAGGVNAAFPLVP